ncbi:MAG TPA: hypothetical protein VHB53_01030 [Solirubrobacterales bacterium]|nr:hypothetical protein [Solirubrobacterales bacterium]
MLAATKIDGRTIRVKSLPGNRLQPASVPGNRLRKGTIPGNRIAPGSLKGAQIDVGSLGQVPDAAHADSADTARHAQTATAADHAADATTVNGHAVGCAESQREWAGACWDIRPSEAAVTADEAIAACAAAGGELPDVVPLVAFIHESGVQSSAAGEWTKSENLVAAGIYTLAVVEKGTFSNFEHLAAPEHFRCVRPFLG